jgi:TonB family protein
VPLSYAEPHFPAGLSAAITSGTAVIEFLVDDDGSVHLPRIVSASNSAFGYAGVQAVSEWQFMPPACKGKAVITRGRVSFQFVRPHTKSS